jgi:large repetitive protein
VAKSGSGITSGGTGDLGAGQVVTFTVNMSENVTVNTTGGTPTLSLNDLGTATYQSGSGSNALTFTYTVAGCRPIRLGQELARQAHPAPLRPRERTGAC